MQRRYNGKVLSTSRGQSFAEFKTRTQSLS